MWRIDQWGYQWGEFSKLVKCGQNRKMIMSEARKSSRRERVYCLEQAVEYWKWQRGGRAIQLIFFQLLYLEEWSWNWETWNKQSQKGTDARDRWGDSNRLSSYFQRALNLERYQTATFQARRKHRQITLNCFWVTAKAIKGMGEGLKSTDRKMSCSIKKTKTQHPE